MATSALSEIESQFAKLPAEVELSLERLLHRLRAGLAGGRDAWESRAFRDSRRFRSVEGTQPHQVDMGGIFNQPSHKSVEHDQCSRRFFLATTMKLASFAVLFVLIVGCASNEAAKQEMRRDSEMESEKIFKAISYGSKSERHEAIGRLSNAFNTLTNRTPAQLKLIEMPDELTNAALSHPFKDNRLAKLWFKTVEVLIEELKTEERENAGTVLVHIAMAPWTAN
jgi:hypothetical protein